MTEANEIDEAFRQYVARTSAEHALPDVLCDDAPIPPTWPHGDGASWEEWRKRAVGAYKARSVYEFVLQIAGGGQRPHEVASGQLDSDYVGTEGSGRVVRPQPPTTTPEQQERAAELLREIDRTRAGLDPIFRHELEQVALGVWRGQHLRADVVIAEAASAVRQREIEIAQAREVEATSVLVRVLAPFTSIGGRGWAVGEYRVSPEVVDELRTWRERMEAQAAQRGETFSVPFEILER